MFLPYSLSFLPYSLSFIPAPILPAENSPLIKLIFSIDQIQREDLCPGHCCCSITLLVGFPSTPADRLPYINSTRGKQYTQQYARQNKMHSYSTVGSHMVGPSAPWDPADCLSRVKLLNNKCHLSIYQYGYVAQSL